MLQTGFIVVDSDNGKECTKCGIIKPGHEFSKDSYSKDGLSSQCLECRREAKISYNARQNIDKYRREFLATYRAALLEGKKRDDLMTRKATTRYAREIAYEKFPEIAAFIVQYSNYPKTDPNKNMVQSLSGSMGNISRHTLKDKPKRQRKTKKEKVVEMVASDNNGATNSERPNTIIELTHHYLLDHDNMPPDDVLAWFAGCTPQAFVWARKKIEEKYGIKTAYDTVTGTTVTERPVKKSEEHLLIEKLAGHKVSDEFAKTALELIRLKG